MKVKSFSRECDFSITKILVQCLPKKDAELILGEARCRRFHSDVHISPLACHIKEESYLVKFWMLFGLLQEIVTDL